MYLFYGSVIVFIGAYAHCRMAVPVMLLVALGPAVGIIPRFHGTPGQMLDNEGWKSYEVI